MPCLTFVFLQCIVKLVGEMCGFIEQTCRLPAYYYTVRKCVINALTVFIKHSTLSPFPSFTHVNKRQPSSTLGHVIPTAKVDTFGFLARRPGVPYRQHCRLIVTTSPSVSFVVYLQSLSSDAHKERKNCLHLIKCVTFQIVAHEFFSL